MRLFVYYRLVCLEQDGRWCRRMKIVHVTSPLNPLSRKGDFVASLRFVYVYSFTIVWSVWSGTGGGAGV
ncbi:MAG: hypothetical protein E7116_08595 [Bacteroidales bacterium]|nr:hypothetical protein [Bacteroidales bacterium]